MARRALCLDPIGCAGQIADKGGLVYLRARYYDPNSGRFMSRDPLLGGANVPLSLNQYAYVQNDPSLTADPTGLAPAGPPNDQASYPYTFTVPGKSRALTDNACFSSANGSFWGELVIGACTAFTLLGNGIIQYTENGITYTVPAIFAAGSPPNGGSGDDIDHDLRTATGKYTDRASTIIKALGITARQFGKGYSRNQEGRCW